MPAFARVLVVDDDVDRRFLVGAFLKQIGHDPVLAESGEAALRLVEDAQAFLRRVRSYLRSVGIAVEE